MTGLSRPFGARFAIPLLVLSALNAINTTMIAVALVPIAVATGTSAAETIWLVASLYLVSAIAQPTMGVLADRVGPRRIAIAGMAVAGLGGILPLLVPTFAGALVARVVIGLGTSAGYPAALTAIRDRSVTARREPPPQLLAAVSIASLVTASIGPLLGGLLVEAFGWQSIFAVNLPYALVAIALVLAGMPADRDRLPAAPGAAAHHGGRLDMLGFALFAITLATVLLFLLDLDAGLYVLLAASALAAAALVLWERRHPRPFIDVRMLVSNAPLVRTYARLFLVYTCTYLVIYGFTQWLQAIAGYSADAAGLMQLPAIALAGLTATAIARTRRLRLPLVIAAVAPIVGGLLLATTHVGTPAWLLLVAMALFGIAQGLAGVSNQAAMYRQAPPGQTGSVAGLSRTSVQVGAVTASAVIGVVFGEVVSDAGLHILAWIVVALGATALVLTIADRALRT